MNEYILNAGLDTSGYLSNLDNNIIDNFYKLLNLVDALHSLENNYNGLINLESLIYKDILSILRNCKASLTPKNSEYLESQICTISKGIYDLRPISLKINSDNKYIFLFGKILSAEDKTKSYSGVIGLEENRFDNYLKDYKRAIIDVTNLFKLIDIDELDKLEGLENRFSCINVIRFAGYLNKRDLPISLFFSGDKNESVSALSNTTLFTNIYFERFEIVSRLLGKSCFYDLKMLDDVDSDNINNVLLLWFWGHDVGHFLGVDNLVNNISDDDMYLYSVLHELKSDFISLYFLKNLSKSLLKLDPKIVFLIFLSEMIRYIRRGGMNMYPDTASAYITFKIFISNNVLSFDNRTNKYRIDYEMMNDSIDELLNVVLDIFHSGSVNILNSFFGKFKLTDQINGMDNTLDSDILFKGIPKYINIIN